MEIIVLALCVVLCYMLFKNIKEGLDAVVVTNAFSNLRCISDNLPIVRLVDNKTFQCLSKNNNDYENCMLRSDFKIPDNVKCNDINTFLIKEIRNKNSPVRKVYDDLEKNVNYNLLTCNQDGLTNPDHWCGQTYNYIKNEKCTSNEGKFGLWVNPCKNIPQYIDSGSSGYNTSSISKSEILDAKSLSKLVTDISRSKSSCGTTNACKNVLVTPQCTFKNENNGNISIFDKRTNTKIWQSNTSNIGTPPYKVLLETNGDLVVKDKDNNNVWSSNSNTNVVSKLYRANLLDKNNKCTLEITDKNDNLVWKTN